MTKRALSFLICLFIFKNSYKRFNRLTKRKNVLHHINLTELLQNPLFLRNGEEKLIHQCFRAANKQALFWVEAHKYFVQDRTKVGKQILLQENMEGEKKRKVWTDNCVVMRIK